MLANPLPARYFFFAGCVLAFAGSAILALLGDNELFWLAALVTGALSLVGVIDVTQTQQSIRRNYPILAHLRFLLESIRPEIRQYFLEKCHPAIPSGTIPAIIWPICSLVVEGGTIPTIRPRYITAIRSANP